MHIVQLLPELKQGGVETVVLALNRELIRAGHQSTVISAGGRLADQVETDGGRHIRMDVCSKNPASFFARVRELRTTLSSLSPDLLHVHSRVPAWLTWFANRKLQLPWVTTVHGFNSVSRYSAIMTRGDRVICVSNPVKDYIRQNYNTPSSKICVIHSGLDLDRYDPERVDARAVEALQSRFDLKGCFVAAAIGRITELKDYETFIRAIASALPRRPELRGLIVGNVRSDKQNYYEKLISLIHELNLADKVNIAIDLTDMPSVYALADIVVSCSKKPESFGLTLIEALAMNTPVIATRHGGPLDIVRENENGRFFPPRDSDALAALLADFAPPAGAGLRSDVLERFSLDRMISDTIQVYMEVARSGQ